MLPSAHVCLLQFVGEEDSIWWVTGGSYSSNSRLKSTESYSTSQNAFTMSDVELPEGEERHDLVNVNSTHMVLIPGWEVSDTVYSFDR